MESVPVPWSPDMGRPKDILAVPVDGGCMAPAIRDGDVVLVNTARRHLLEGAIVAFSRRDNLRMLLKRAHLEGGAWWLVSDDGQHRYPVDAGTTIVGTVVSVVRTTSQPTPTRHGPDRGGCPPADMGVVEARTELTGNREE